MPNPLLDALGPAPDQEELLFEDVGDDTDALTFTDLSNPVAARPAFSAAPAFSSAPSRPRGGSGPRASGGLKHLAYSQPERSAAREPSEDSESGEEEVTSRRTPGPPDDATVRMSVGDPIGLSLRDSDDWRHASTPPQQPLPPPARDAQPQPSVRKGATGVRIMAERFLKNDVDDENGEEGGDESPFPPLQLKSPPPLAAEKNEVFGNLLGADDDDDSSEEEEMEVGGASDSEEDVVETFGDVPLPPKPPPPAVTSRAAGVKKCTGGSAGDAAADEWATVATNATEFSAAAAETTAGGEASAETTAAATALDDLKPSEDAMEGSKELGSARMDGDDEDDDEFGYAFDGGRRAAPSHVKKFVAPAVPTHLVSNVRGSLMSLQEDEEEEDEEVRVQEQEAEAAEPLDAHIDVRFDEVSAANNNAADEWNFEGFAPSVVTPPVQAPPPPPPAAKQQVPPAPAIVATAEQEAEPLDVGFDIHFDEAEAPPVSFPAMVVEAPTSLPPPPEHHESRSAEELADEFERVTMEQERASAATTSDVGKGKKGAAGSGLPPVSYTAIRKFLEVADIRPFLATVVVEEVSYANGIVAKLFALCFGPPRLDGPLVSQRERLFAIAKMPFDDAEPMHVRMLQSIFRRFTGVTGSVQRYGSHWEDLGFQGQDPATDLRSVGILGLVQLLYLHNHHKRNAERVYRLSRHRVQEFPLAPLSINITMATLTALRRGLLSREIMRRNDVLAVANDFYVGAFYTFYAMWRNGGKTMRDSGFVKRELEQFIHNGANTQRVLDTARTTLADV